ncbi:MAG: 16S rRNA (cytosine(967)-C(5))-methyltransferase RsmB [Veillonellales bacterium]
MNCFKHFEEVIDTEAREAALKIINDVHTNGAYANITLAKTLTKHEFSEQDRRFITELVYGTIKTGETLDWIIGHFSQRSLTKIPPIILDILRMGIYQMFFLTKVPDSAACNQAVQLTKKYGHAGTVKFVNAVLRNAGRTRGKIVYPERDKDAAAFLALKYFHPKWLIARWLKRFGFDATEALCQANNTTPPLSLRTNTLKIQRSELLEVLGQEKVICQPSVWTPEGIICREYPSLTTLKSLQAGLFQVQDESSMLVAHVLDPQPGDFIIDACSAPGGKSTHMAALMNNTGRILSLDIHEHKLLLIQENAKRLGINIIETFAADSSLLAKNYAFQADRVLVDAPCSGLGVIRRKPDSRWRKTESMLTELPKLQTAILASAAECVKPGGVLVYSTCTIEPEENDQVIQAFLHNQKNFQLDSVGSYLPVPAEVDTLQLLPHIHQVDGFYIARMIRIK